MEKLQNSITQVQKKLDQTRKERQQASIEQFASIDKEILRQELLLNRLKESQWLQELREKGQIPIDTFSQAKLYVMESLEQAMDEGQDLNGNDKRIIATFRLEDIIDKLELLKMASETPDIEPIPDNEEFSKQFDSFIMAKKEKVKNAREKLLAQAREIECIEMALRDATIAGNPEEIIKHSDFLETARKTRAYLESMVQETEKSETFPEGTIRNAWNEICDIYRYEWLLRIEIINTAQEIHHQAAQELTELTNRLKSIRNAMQRIGKENGSTDEIVKYNQNITKGIDINGIKQIPQNDREMIYRAIYHNRQELL